MKQIILSLILFMVFSISCFGQDKPFDESVLSENGKQAYQTLLKIQLFAIGGIGYSGAISEGDKAFDILLEDKEAVSAFKSLIKKATIEGALYGLFGLKMVDCSCYREEFINFKKARISKGNNEKLSFQAGCNFSEFEKSADKEFFIDYMESNNYFEQLVIYKKQRNKLKEQKTN